MLYLSTLITLKRIPSFLKIFFVIFLMPCFAESYSIESSTAKFDYLISKFHHTIENQKFDLFRANSITDYLVNIINSQTMDVYSYETAVDLLNLLRCKAEEYIKEEEKLLQSIQLLPSDSKILQESIISPILQGKELENVRRMSAKHIIDAKMFLNKVDAITDEISFRAQELTKSVLEQNKINFIKIIYNNPKIFTDFISKISINKFYRNSGLLLLGKFHTAIILSILFFLFYLKRKIERIIKQHLRNNIINLNNENIPLFKLFCSMQTRCIIILFLIISYLYLSILSSKLSYTSLIEKFNISVLLIVIYLSLIDYYFRQNILEKNVLIYSFTISSQLRKYLISLGYLTFIGWIFYLLLSGQSVPEPINILLLATFNSLLILHFLKIVWLFSKFDNGLIKKIFLLFIRNILLFTFTVLLFANWAGYHYFTTYLIISTISSLFAFMVFSFMQVHVSIFFRELVISNKNWVSKFRSYLGISSKMVFYEAILLRIIVNVIIISTFLLSLLRIWGILPVHNPFLADDISIQIWGLSRFHYQNFIQIITEGFNIGGLIIKPARLLIALLVFSILNIINRIVQVRMVKHWHISGILSKTVSQSLAMLINYIGFSIIVILSLVIAGISFTNLTILAGTISIGLGFGLKSILNNFISGLILLIERPIKIGDRVIIGSIEGHVRSINIRSTVIEAIDQTYLIVPNAELLDKQVHNLMFSNKQVRVCHKIKISNQKDTEKVKNILLTISNNHPDIVKGSSEVILDKFDNNIIQLELIHVIFDIDKKRTIYSELNNAILNELIKNKIDIVQVGSDN